MLHIASFCSTKSPLAIALCSFVILVFSILRFVNFNNLVDTSHFPHILQQKLYQLTIVFLDVCLPVSSISTIHNCKHLRKKIDLEKKVCVYMEQEALKHLLHCHLYPLDFEISFFQCIYSPQIPHLPLTSPKQLSKLFVLCMKLPPPTLIFLLPC